MMLFLFIQTPNETINKAFPVESIHHPLNMRNWLQKLFFFSKCSVLAHLSGQIHSEKRYSLSNFINMITSGCENTVIFEE